VEFDPPSRWKGFSCLGGVASPARSCLLRYLYSLSGVIDGLARSLPFYSAVQPVNNAAGALNSNTFPLLRSLRYFGRGSGTNKKPTRLTSLAQLLDRSRSPNVNTHSHVPTQQRLTLYSLRPTFIDPTALTYYE